IVIDVFGSASDDKLSHVVAAPSARPSVMSTSARRTAHDPPGTVFIVGAPICHGSRFGGHHSGASPLWFTSRCRVTGAASDTLARSDAVGNCSLEHRHDWRHPVC